MTGDYVYLRHIVDATEKIASYVAEGFASAAKTAPSNAERVGHSGIGPGGERPSQDGAEPGIGGVHPLVVHACHGTAFSAAC